MSYYRYKRLQQYINGQPTDVYKKGDRIDDVDYSTYESCMGGTADTRWVSIPQTVCYDGDLWSMEKEQISYDGGTSWSDTGNSRRASVVEQSSSQCFLTDWRVVPGEYICMMYAKWTKEAEYASYDGGQTWAATGNTRRGETMIEQLSSDCGVIYQWIPTGEYICQGYNKYMKEQRVYSTDNGRTWTDTGDRRTGGLVEADSPYCGYEQYIYQWVDVAGEYVCQGYDKYTKQKEQRSSDMGVSWEDTGNTRAGEYIESLSTDCGVTYRWITVPNEYVCAGYDKYSKEKLQYSTDGTTWVDTGNTRAGSTLIEHNSTDCGYDPSHDYSNMPLTFEGLENGNLMLMRTADTEHQDKYPLRNIKYKKNDGAWTDYTYNTSISFVAGDKISWKGEWTGDSSFTWDYLHRFASSANHKVYGNPLSLTNAASINDGEWSQAVLSHEQEFFYLFGSDTGLIDASNLWLNNATLTKECYVYMFGNCTSLTAAPALPTTTLANSCYMYMFFNCTSLTAAPALPATTLAEFCYGNMFQGCKSLTTAPALPATTLARYCYYFMFNGCTSLTTASVLPATTLTDNCYNGMFQDCTSLTTAPVLPATTLVRYCYTAMFNGCTSLNSVTCRATDISATQCTFSWLYKVSSTGTFTKAAGVTWSSGSSGIPTGWTVVEAS